VEYLMKTDQRHCLTACTQQTTKGEVAQQQTQTPKKLHEEEKALPEPPRAVVYQIAP
jgi:hypothetical protein